MKELEIIVAVQRIDRLFNEEKTSETGLRELIKGIRILMMDIRSNVRNIVQSSCGHRITEIYRVSCHIETIIDTNSVRKKYKREMATKRCFGLSSCLSSWLDDSNDAVKSNINSLWEIIKEHTEYMNKDISRVEDDKDESYSDESRSRSNINLNEPNIIVGLHEMKNQVFQHLREEPNNLRVIALCGLGGVGKTTLAKEVFNDPRTAYDFVLTIWINVSSKMKTKDVLRSMFYQLHRRNKYATSTDSECADKVRDSLRKCGSYLIVLDDVCSAQVLDELYHFLPDNQKYCRILFTTRKRQVAEYHHPKPIIYEVRPLKEADALELFMKNMYTWECNSPPGYKSISDASLNSNKEKIARELVKHCDGLPVAIVELARKLPIELDIRNEPLLRVLHSVNQIVTELLAPSFDELPDHLKLCFLYLGTCPEDLTIDVDKLYHFWIVEGIVKQQDIRIGETLLNVAERYLTELEGRYMVEVEEEKAPRIRRKKSCRVHRMMRQLSILEGNQIDFSQIIDFRRDSNSSLSSSTNKPRSLFVCLERPEDISSILDNKELTKHLRILQFLDSYKQQRREPIGLLGKFEDNELRLLRLLDFDGVDFRQKDFQVEGMSNMNSKLLEGIANLVNLRYLSFKGCFMEKLPLTIKKLSYLQILDLRVDDLITEMTLPNVLWKMKKMKHLYLPWTFRTYGGDKLRLDGLTELETLENFFTSVCDVSDLHTLSKLHNLAVKIDGNLPDLQFITEHVIQPSNKQIQLSIDLRNFDCYVQKRHSLLIEVLQSQAVRIFCIEGHIRELPSNYNISPSLTKIVLSGSELEKDPLTTLATLPNLQVLVLNNNAFVGTDMITPSLGFPELKHLELLNLQFLEKWMVANNSMPKLCNTKVGNCMKLSKLDGFEFLTALKELEINGDLSKPFEDWLRYTYGRQQKNVKITFSTVHGEPSYIPERKLDLARADITGSQEEPSSSEPSYIPEPELDSARSEITRSQDEPSSSGVYKA